MRTIEQITGKNGARLIVRFAKEMSVHQRSVIIAHMIRLGDRVAAKGCGYMVEPCRAPKEFK